MTSITLFVPRVHCADETTGSFREKFGNDEMYLGAVFVRVSANRSFDVRVVRTRSVGSNFDDKETVNWNQPLFTFDLGDESINPFPKAVLASLVLAEHDSGNGRNDFLEKVAKEFSDKLTAATIDGIAKAALAAAGVTDGGGWGGPIVRDHRGETPVIRDHRRDRGGDDAPIIRDHRRAGVAAPLMASHEAAVIVGGESGGVFSSDGAGTWTVPASPATAPTPADGIVVSALKDWAKDEIKKIVNYLIDKVSSWAGDDIFPPVLKSLDIPTPNHTWNGIPDTPEEIAEFVGHDGKYQVSMLWQLR